MNYKKKILSDIFSPFINYSKGITSSVLGYKSVVEINDFGKLKLYCSNRFDLQRTMLYSDEKEALSTFLFLLRKNDVVWDIGGHIGLFTLHSALNTKEVVVFEPEPAFYHRLNDNIALNGIKNIEAFNLAIGDKKGKMSLQTSGLTGYSPSLSDIDRHENTVEVEVETIDSLIEKGYSKPNAIKIDIEGAEILALKGGRNLFSSNDKPRFLFIEVHPTFLKHFNSSDKDVINLVKEYGYTILTEVKRDDQYHIIAYYI